MSIHKAPTPVRSFGPKLDAHQIIVRPLVTEKGNRLTDELRTYMFEVNPLATKTQVKQAVEALFDVQVDKVATQTRRGKSRRFRFKFGETKAWKKAIVKLKPDNKIDFFQTVESRSVD